MRNFNSQHVLVVAHPVLLLLLLLLLEKVATRSLKAHSFQGTVLVPVQFAIRERRAREKTRSGIQVVVVGVK